MPSSDLSLRRALPADAPAVRELTRAAYAKWVAVVGREPRPMTADYDQAVKNHRIDLLYSGSDLAGLIETIPAADHLLIENVAVTPAFQGRGLGRRLLAHAEHLASKAGFVEMRLYTNQRFTENIALYRRLGYAVTHEETVAAGVIVHMAKRLDAV